VGDGEAVAAIHGPRLERLLERLVDSPVRGFAYEAAGSVNARHLQAGREIVESAGERWRIPVTVIDWSREEPAWAERAADAAGRLLVV
jgi:hypothetical protein